MPQGGNLDIECSFDDDCLLVAFMDTGKGIAKENIGQVTDAYFTTKTKGSGLGLMVVERIVREHGAELAIDSEFGKGKLLQLGSLALQGKSNSFSLPLRMKGCWPRS